MSSITRQDFVGNLLKLTTETFEGPPAEGGSAFLDKGGGLFQTLAGITAVQASRSPAPGAPTLAAHCRHLGYYVRVVGEFMRGGKPQVDWPSSWGVQIVTATQWDEVRAELRDTFTAWRELIETTQAWGDDEVGDSLAILAHTAYHLGAIRQLLRFVADPR